MTVFAARGVARAAAATATNVAAARLVRFLIGMSVSVRFCLHARDVEAGRWQPQYCAVAKILPDNAALHARRSPTKRTSSLVAFGRWSVDQWVIRAAALLARGDRLMMG